MQSKVRLLVLGAALWVSACGGASDADRTVTGTGAGNGGADAGASNGADTNATATNGGSNDMSEGISGASGSGSSSGEVPDCDSKLAITVRDFTEEHPDFESFDGNSLRGIVKEDLGSDKKPVYASAGPTPVNTGAAEFDQWYRDTPGVNMQIPVEIEFTEESPGVFVYDNSEFFPIDDMGFGNGPNDDGFIGIGGSDAEHNFLFTTEAHTLFSYQGGELFTFRGDDDLWVFINGKLAVDLGGLHSVEEGTVSLDGEATRLGIELGKTYPMDIFHAERHTNESNYRIETTIDLSCIQNVPVI